MPATWSLGFSMDQYRITGFLTDKGILLQRVSVENCAILNMTNDLYGSLAPRINRANLQCADMSRGFCVS